MDILYALEKIRTPFWNGVMSAVTQLGGEVIFIVAAVVVFWCVSKWEGYYLMTIAFCGTVLNQFLKLICRVRGRGCGTPTLPLWRAHGRRPRGTAFPSRPYPERHRALRRHGPVGRTRLGAAGADGTGAGHRLFPDVSGGT